LQLADYNYRFVSAIDGRNQGDTHNGLVTAPVEAIWNSHSLALKHFLATRSSYCLILEDDFLIRDRKKFGKLVKILLKEDFDLAQVGWLTTGLDVVLLRTYESSLYFAFRALNKLSRFSHKLSKVLEKKLRPRRTLEVPKFAIPDSFFPGAHAYIVSRNLAETVLKLNNPTFLATDDFYVALSKMRSFNVFRTKKPFVVQQGESSAGIDRFTQRQSRR
jgi:GR25 family glycosyltransferase involved in LPS biosynthesis